MTTRRYRYQSEKRLAAVEAQRAAAQRAAAQRRPDAVAEIKAAQTRATRTYEAGATVKVRDPWTREWVSAVFVKRVDAAVPFGVVEIDGKQHKVVMERIDAAE